MFALHQKGQDYNSVATVITEIGETKKRKAAEQKERGSSSSSSNNKKAKAKEEEGEEEGYEKDEDEDDGKLCKICFASAIDCVLLNCGHLCCCLECPKALQACPMCRSPIERVVKTFVS